jgi:multidrug efflux pump subunit AcrA (membrane-fusion protein)
MNTTAASTPLSEPPLARPELDEWASRLLDRLKGVIEIAVLRVEGQAAQPLASAPKTMPLNRLGYAEAIARARSTRSTTLMPLDRVEDSISEVIVMPLPVLQGEAVLVVGISELPARQIELLIEHISEASGWAVHHLSMGNLQQAFRSVDAQRTSFNMTAEMLDAANPTEARQALVSLIAEALSASRVALVRRRAFRRARLIAVAGEARFDRRLRLNDLTEQVGHEALMRREAIIWRRGDPVGTVLATLSEAHGDAAIAAMPLGDGEGEMSEVLVIQWPTLEAMPDLKLWAPVWVLSRPVLLLQEKAGRGALGRLFSTMSKGASRLFGPRALKTKIVTLAVIAALTAIFLVDVPNTLRATATIDDPDLRVLTSPADGFLASVTVLPGDSVVVGQEVARLDTSDLILREAELEAQLARHLSEAALARGERDLGRASVAEAEANETQARLDMARRDLNRAVIRAQTNGLVLEGDLRQRIGSQVSYGESLIQIAPRNAVELRLSVANRDGARLATGLTGKLRLNAAPDQPLDVTVMRVKPGAETLDGEMRFVAFASLGEAPLRLENGMQGVARLSVGEAKIWEVWLKPAFEIAYLFFWRWLP